MNTRSKSTDCQNQSFKPKVNKQTLKDTRPLLERIFDPKQIQKHQEKQTKMGEDRIKQSCSSAFFKKQKNDGEIQEKLYNDKDVYDELYKNLNDTYKLSFKFSPSITEPNAGIKSKISSREQDIQARMYGYKDIMESRVNNSASKVNSEYDAQMTFTPKIDIENFQECSPIKEREGLRFEQQLSRSSQDYQNKMSNLEDEWAKIQTTECQHSPKINKASQQLQNRPANIFSELQTRKRKEVAFVNKDLTFQPKLK